MKNRFGLSLAALTFAGATLGLAPAAHAASYSFSINGSGITASGVFDVMPGGLLGSSVVKGISGTFADSTNHFSGVITGLDSAALPVFNASPPAAPNTFSAPAAIDGLTYDNLFWSGANSPAVCTDALAFFGGYFDVYGMAFNVAGGHSVDLWSDGSLGGYQLDDTTNDAPNSMPNFQGLAYAVNVTAAPTPEPSSLLLLGTGIPGLAFAARRKWKAAA